MALFLELDLDIMVVMRTAPTQSRGNLVERVMSVLNLGLQGVALTREVSSDDEMEKDIKKCSGMSGIRKAAEAYGRDVVCSPVVSEENAEEQLGQQLSIQNNNTIVTMSLCR